MRTARGTRSILLSIALTGLAACGGAPEGERPPAAEAAPAGGSDASPPPAAVQARDVCTMVSDEEFQKATGFAVHSKKSYPGEAPGCDWELTTSQQSLHRLNLNLRFQGGRQRFDFIANSMAKIPNLGDAAAKTGGNINGTVWAVKGDTLATLNYSLPVATSDPDPIVVPLLELLLSRL